MKKLAIFGAGGHGRVVADVATESGWAVTFFDDGMEKGSRISAWCVGGGSAELMDKLDVYDGIIVGIGDNQVRLTKSIEFQAKGGQLVSVIHPQATVSKYVELGVGSVIMAGAVLNHGASTGMCCIINTLASVDHDCRLDAGAHISPGANLAGGVMVGKLSNIGVGSSICPLVKIGTSVVVGAGSVVVKDIQNDQIVAGCPARPLYHS